MIVIVVDLENSFTVFVNPATPVNELVEALAKTTGCRMGNADAPWGSVVGKPAASQCLSVETKMFLSSSDKDFSTGEARSLLTLENLWMRPAGIRELLVFMTTFVSEQLKYPLAALGEPDDLNGPVVAYGYMSEGQRLLFVGRPSDNCQWEAGCRFLVVQDQPA